MCRGVNADGLARAARRDPRFIETAYLLGLREVGQRKLDEAESLFNRAYAWRPRWPSLTLSIANVAMTAEEFEKAERLFSTKRWPPIRARSTRCSARSRR